MAAFLATRMIGERSRKILGITNSRLSSSGTVVARAFSSSIIPITETLLAGDVFSVAGTPIEWEEHYNALQLVNNPSLFDVLVMSNFYGDIISSLCALVGGLTLTPSCNIGEDGIALAEVVHDSVPVLVGKNLANPTAMLLSGVMMLRHLKSNEESRAIYKATIFTIVEGKYRTADLGGTSTKMEFTNAISDHLFNP